jgi:hypothetical protein
MKRLTLPFAVLLAGCQGGVAIVGSLPEGASCRLSVDLIDGKGSLIKFPQARNISGSFREFFSVEPTNHTYSTVVLCGDRTVFTRNFKYPSDANPTKPLEIGAIEL